jgi:hypothetical protein
VPLEWIGTEISIEVHWVKYETWFCRNSVADVELPPLHVLLIASGGQ